MSHAFMKNMELKCHSYFPKDVLDSLTTTMSPEEETIPPILRLEIDPPDIHGSIDPSGVFMGPTSLIVYNFSDPVTSLYIYEMSSSDLITRSFLAGDDYVIKTSPIMTHHEMGKSIQFFYVTG